MRLTHLLVANAWAVSKVIISSSFGNNYNILRFVAFQIQELVCSRERLDVAYPGSLISPTSIMHLVGRILGVLVRNTQVKT